jgi:hypothetical protein
VTFYNAAGEPEDFEHAVISDLDEISETQAQILDVLKDIRHTLSLFYEIFLIDQSAVALTMITTRGQIQMTTFSVDTTDGTANLQFVDDHGDPTAGPNDSVTGQPVVPEVSSDTTSVVTVGPTTSAPSGVGGAFTAPLTMVAEGVANISVEPLTNSDGSPVVDSAGNPFTLPAPVEVTVTAGEAAGLTMTVTG